MGLDYYKAREAVEYLRVIEKRNGTQAADIRFEADGDNQGIVSMLNTILTLMTVIKRILERPPRGDRNILEHQDSQTNTAKRLQIRQPTVHRILANDITHTGKHSIRLKSIGGNYTGCTFKEIFLFYY